MIINKSVTEVYINTPIELQSSYYSVRRLFRFTHSYDVIRRALFGAADATRAVSPLYRNLTRSSFHSLLYVCLSE